MTPSKRLFVVVALVLGLVLSACEAPGDAATPPPEGQAAPSVAPASEAPSPSPSATLPPTGPSAEPSAAIQTEAIEGVWRVRVVLAPGDRTALLPGDDFGDEAFYVAAPCRSEPCERIAIATTPLGRANPVTTYVLNLQDGVYVSEASEPRPAPCLTPDGVRVDGGSEITTSLRVAAVPSRTSGSAVSSVELVGERNLQMTPTPIGEAAGCVAVDGTYELSGRREAVAVVGGKPPSPVVPPASPSAAPTPSAGASPTPEPAHPDSTIEVEGATIDYFPVSGDTHRELSGSMARGGVKACGEIEYEWFRGDDRPSACSTTEFGPWEESLTLSGDASSPDCRITDANVVAAYTVHFPNWTSADDAPKRLQRWWDKIVDFIRDHEAGHIRISRRHVADLNTRLEGAPCGERDAIIKAWAKKLSAAQEDYDRKAYRTAYPAY